MAGEVNVDALLRRITIKDFREWQAYYELEPFGELRADYRSASICLTLANLKRGKNQKPYKLEDFLFKFDEEPKRGQSIQEKLAVMTVIARAWNAAQAEGKVNVAAAEAVTKSNT